MLRYLLILQLIFSISAQADLISAKRAFVSNNFKVALEELQGLPSTSETSYFRGLVQARLGRFDLAVKEFEKALRLKNKSKDLSYELGQAYYSTNALNRAIAQFQRSQKLGFKRPSSIYYIGYIHQILENHQKAIDSFTKLINLPRPDKSLQQIAYYQRAYSRFALEENNPQAKEIAKKHILPDLEKAKSLLKSNLITKINAQIKSVKQKFDLDPYIMKNGRSVKERDWDLSLSHKMVYDSNVSLQSDTPLERTTNVDSFYNDTSIDGSYRFIHNRQWIVTPGVSFQQRLHTNRESSDVYTNDTYDIQFRVDLSYETNHFDKPSSYLAELVYNYNAKDRLARKERIFNSRYKLLGIGHRFQYFKIGQTTLKLKIKSLKSYSSTQNNNTRTFSLSQLHILPSGRVMVYTFQADFTAVSDPNSDSDNYLLRADYIWPKIFPGYTFNPYLSVAFLDPVSSRDSRGLEKTLTPGFKMTRDLSKNFKVIAGYSYQKKFSKDKSQYAYSKNEFLFNLKYQF